MVGLNRWRLAVGVGFCVVIPILNGCQEPGEQSGASAPVASAPASATPAAQGAPPDALVAYQLPQTGSPLANCNLERLNSELFVAQSLTLNPSQTNTFRGWVDPAGVADPLLWLRFDDAQAKRYLHVPIKLTIERPDVLASDKSAPRVSGFELSLPRDALPAGQYHVYVAVTSGVLAHVCDNGRHVDVGNEK